MATVYKIEDFWKCAKNKGLERQSFWEALFGNAPAAYEGKFLMLMDRFLYRAEPTESKADEYMIHRSAWLQNKVFVGDCDDFAATIADFLLSTGYNWCAERVLLHLVGDPTGKNKVGHVVCSFEDELGRVWYFDNQERFVQSEKRFKAKLKAQGWVVLLPMQASTKLLNSKVV